MLPAGDRSYRSLVSLASGGATARTFNLLKVWNRFAGGDEYESHPMFRSPILNRSIIVKHRLRKNESDMFDSAVQNATKVLLPIDITDLKMGARYFFVGQRGYREVLEELGAGDTEAALLTLLHELPSLDPFLMRERLKKAGHYPARCYFELTDADLRRMMAFVTQSLQPLIGVSFGEGGGPLDTRTSRLATKILANEGDAEMEPLRQSLNMSPGEFDEGIFCWKGFLYYKWSLGEMLPKVGAVLNEIREVRPVGQLYDEDRAYLQEAKLNLHRNITRACVTVTKTLKVYEDAFNDLAVNSQPRAFRDFLLRAPTLFQELGERLGAVQHILTFWRFRFPHEGRHKVQVDELIDMFMDFEGSLNFEQRHRA